MRRAALVLTTLVLVVGASVLWLGRPVTMEVASDAELVAALADAPEGAVVRLAPGAYAPFSIERRLTILGGPGVTVAGPIHVRADGAVLDGVLVRGGDSGVVVRDVEDVRLLDLIVVGATMHGVEVVDASAEIRGCTVTGMVDPRAQAIEVRNANGRPTSLIQGCVVDSGMEGIVTHVSRVAIMGNRVTGTSMRAIAITEMSEGMARGNRIDDVTGVGLYCGDMSHCEFVGNQVRAVASDGSGIRSRDGLAAVALYYATMRLQGNTFDVDGPEPVAVLVGSVQTERFPLGIWPAGWGGLVPSAFVASGIAIASLLLVAIAVGVWFRRRAPADGPRDAIAGNALLVLLGVLLVQSFHMLEHVVQVIQIHVWDAEVRRGLAGAAVDTEWVHFVYNLAVLAFGIWAWRLVSRLNRTRPAVARAQVFVAAAVVIQGYHFAEHVAKILQHVIWNVDPAPGLVGGRLGLVWFHYGINLAVYLGFAIGIVSIAAPALREWLRAERAPIRAGV